MKRTSVTTIVIAAAASGVVSWIGLMFWRRAGHSLPPVSWMAVVVMVLIALALLIAGWPVGQVTREAREISERRAEGKEPHRPRRRVDPLRAARTFVLAQAATITGALLAGWYGAMLFVLFSGPLVEARLAQLWPAGAAMLAALILLIVGVIVEWFCQLPPSDDAEGELAN